MLKSYRVITSALYRLIILIGYPFAVLAGCALLQLVGMDGHRFHFMATASFICSVIPTVEIISDYFLFAGANSHKGDKLDFLKTSQKGIVLYRNALYMDQLRRIVYLVGMYLVNILIYQIKEGFPGISSAEVLNTIVFVGLDLFIATFAIFVCRFTQNVFWNFAFSQILAFCMFLPLMGGGGNGVGMIVATVVILLLAVIMSAFGPWYSLKVRRESYCDE